MKKISKKTIIKTLIYLAVGFVFALFFMGDAFGGGLSAKELVMAISNAFFVPAVIFIGLGLLAFISTAGGFYAIQYLGYSLRYTFGPKKEDLEKRSKSYFDFCEEKKAQDAKRGGHESTYIMLFTGVFYLVVCLIFTAVFYKL